MVYDIYMLTFTEVGLHFLDVSFFKSIDVIFSEWRSL